MENKNKNITVKARAVPPFDQGEAPKIRGTVTTNLKLKVSGKNRGEPHRGGTALAFTVLFIVSNF